MTPTLIRFWLCFASLLMTLAACGPTQHIKEPVVHYTPVSHDVFYPRHTVLATRSETESLKTFLAESGHNPGGNIALLYAPGDNPAIKERLDGLSRQLKEMGYPYVVAAEDGAVPAERIRLSTSTASVATPDCPDWTYSHMENYRNTTLSNLGCSHAVNLSKMVQDPNDLIAGKGNAGADALRSSGVIEFYREPPVAAPTAAATAQGGLTGAQ
jgi:pilus biogenesis lipoprotein CpaD